MCVCVYVCDSLQFKDKTLWSTKGKLEGSSMHNEIYIVTGKLDLRIWWVLLLEPSPMPFLLHRLNEY